MNEQKCPNCGNNLLQIVFQGRPALVCENCMLKNGQSIPIDMEKCEFCQTFYFKNKDNLCQCRIIDGINNEQ